MDLLTAATSLLSHPAVGDRESVVRTLVDEQSRITLEGVVGDLQEEMGVAAPELLGVMTEFVGLGGGWSPPFGAFEAAVRGRAHESLVAAASQLAILAHDRGVAGRWHASFNAPVCLRLGDTTVVNLTEASVEAGDDGYEVRGQTAEGERGRWVVCRNEGPDNSLLRSVGFGGLQVRLSSMQDARSVRGIEFLTREPWNLSTDLARAERELAAAEELLRCHSPMFLSWVAGVFRHMAFTDPGRGLMESGSSRELPGFVHVSHGDPLALAEMLVHECSHQYYYLATRAGSVDDGTDTTLYWSPVKQTGRPIANILLAYHAFGNVVLLMRELLASGAGPRNAIEANEADVVQQLRQLQQGLETTRALTETGLGLYQPLRDALRLV
ncbi:hypothetical protein JL475_33975 [Streptomyces sp. M2CJ-2]|uniref:aKG-HExxH-type peptide beta-hydroxylase n=1 Tax=Streptomyces sp. M2CJ-2 TaxID=2803948 RepID=UPI00192926C5|nr:HEXXH motif-containing putative peptide modification protein [Streptomyces sp. M2CJ-2]MBL3670872.1 hypothetical protein [Streptomyces sp. M2CJ-2]